MRAVQAGRIWQVLQSDVYFPSRIQVLPTCSPHRNRQDVDAPRGELVGTRGNFDALTCEFAAAGTWSTPGGSSIRSASNVGTASSQ
eukprot:392285-Prorocentrum_minimum.AAC.1